MSERDSITASTAAHAPDDPGDAQHQQIPLSSESAALDRLDRRDDRGEAYTTVRIPNDLFQRHRSVQVLVSLLVVIATIYAFTLIWGVLTFFSDVILLFFLAWIISFILEPASLFLQSRGLPRALAVTLIYLALLIVIFSSVVLTVPLIAQQVLLLTNEIARTVSPDNINNLNALLVALLERFGLRPADARGMASQLSSQLPLWVGNVEQGSIGAATTLVSSVVGILISMVLITIISFYMMLDGDRLVEGFVLRLPPSWIPDVRLFQDNVQRIFGGFFRAQLILGALYGALTWLVLLVLGVPNGLLIGALSGLLMLLPFLGTFLAIVPPVILTLLESPSNVVAVRMLILLLVLVAAQQVVIQVLGPRIFGNTMGIHPLLLFAALIIGAKVGGVWGAFFAGPIFAVAYAMLDVFYWRVAKRAAIFQPRESDEPLEEWGMSEAGAEVVIPEVGASSQRNRMPVGMAGNMAGRHGRIQQFAPSRRPARPNDDPIRLPVRFPVRLHASRSGAHRNPEWNPWNPEWKLSRTSLVAGLPAVRAAIPLAERP